MDTEPTLPRSLRPLWLMANNYWWTWNTAVVRLFHDADPEAWEALGHNPVLLLQGMTARQFDRLADDPEFVSRLDKASAAFAEYVDTNAGRVSDAEPAMSIAYFSMEFALTESLQSYSGGLGVLAGDHLRSASDLRLDLVGIGLLYSEGYFRQRLNADGRQEEIYRALNPEQHALTLVRDSKGDPMEITVPIAGRTVCAGVWRADVGRVRLYLLDSNVEGNSAEDRRITARLYGGDATTRIQQEMILGIGGIRALDALGIRPEVVHMNEGHSSFLGLERIRSLSEESGRTFEEAREAAAVGTVFTTHTPVASGIDLFPADLVREHMGRYLEGAGISEERLLSLGRLHPDDEAEPLSMAVLGLRLSARRNGVSELHGGVSRRLWAEAWPGTPEALVPIGSVTNGVHLPTWVAPGMAELFDEVIGPIWRTDPSANWQAVLDVPSSRLWGVRNELRSRLVGRARTAFNADVLTIGFARRFTSYKRASLLFRDPSRLAAILNHGERPVQILFAGKAHPRDEPGKQVLHEVYKFARQGDMQGKVAVLEDYDTSLARTLVQGCDVWLNTPLHPLEASGTSGMKSVANGGLHLSVRDGWWAEGFRSPLGWTFGGTEEPSDRERRDHDDAESLYALLEHEVAPLFYDRNGDGVPLEWVRRMKSSIATYAPAFSSGRMVHDYLVSSYRPAAAQWRELTANGFSRSRAQGRA